MRIFLISSFDGDNLYIQVKCLKFLPFVKKCVLFNYNCLTLSFFLSINSVQFPRLQAEYEMLMYLYVCFVAWIYFLILNTKMYIFANVREFIGIFKVFVSKIICRYYVYTGYISHSSMPIQLEKTFGEIFIMSVIFFKNDIRKLWNEAINVTAHTSISLII